MGHFVTGLWARTSALWGKEGVKTVLTDVAIRKAKPADKRYSLVLDLPGLTTLDRAVWQALCSFARWDSPTAPQIGRCWPGLSELARRAGCAKCSLCRTLKRL